MWFSLLLRSFRDEVPPAAVGSMKNTTGQRGWGGENLVSLFDELVTVIQPGEEGDESPLPCEDSGILLQVINIQTAREENKRKRQNSTELTSRRRRYLRASGYENKPAVTGRRG